MKVAVVCNFPFPDGLAATTRIKAYLRGLNEAGCETMVYIINPSIQSGHSQNYESKGVTPEGVSYEYGSNITYSRYRICRVLNNLLINRLRTIRLIAKHHRENNIDYLFIANDQLFNLFFFVIFCRIKNIKPVFITDEYPGAIRNKLKGEISRVEKWLYTVVLSKVNRAVFMTEALNQYFNPKNKIKSHILPTITDYSRFSNVAKSSNTSLYLCYMGNMELSKDNVDNIIIAFSKISEKYKDIQLHLYGSPSEKDRMYLISLIHELGLSNRVILKGRIEYDKVPQVLADAYILVSSQPNTKRAEGGFPTKLGEYLASGVPILLTDVGEISQYVTNGEHLYLVPPEQPDLYADKLMYIIDNYSNALSIAKKGQAHLVQMYNYKHISYQLYKFLEHE